MGVRGWLTLKFRRVHEPEFVYSNTDFLIKLFTEHFLNKKFQGGSFRIQMATELIAAPLYCVTLLLKITLLSFVYRVTLLIPYSL
jgi:hypothetical protein